MNDITVIAPEKAMRFRHNSPFGLYGVEVKIIKVTPKRVLCEATEHGTGPSGREMNPGDRFYAPLNRIVDTDTAGPRVRP